MLGVLLAVVAAGANAIGSVLQRHASVTRDPGARGWRALRALLERPGWTAGILAHVLGFVLQAVALGLAPLSLVQPLLLTELPFTLMLNAVALSSPLRPRGWGAVLAVAAGLALFLGCLIPRPGPPVTPLSDWVVGLVVGVLAVAGVSALAARSRRHYRALLFGVATGATYGLNAALLAGVAVAYRSGWSAVFTTWQTYAVLVGGTLSFVLLQHALSAGDLVAAQPAITLVNPLVALIWGFAVFGEELAVGPELIGVVVGAVVVVAGVLALTREAMPRMAVLEDA